ncbi:MAG TPA: sigma-54 dependent transcriptional regulator [Polyangia bacterium]|jgi:DNA-binding NtrC family response regulator|nr:sigma-54 dependent transcriptional regulator [Polyangia bacterium]
MSPARRPRLLIADDQPDVIEALRLLLKGAGYDVVSAGSPAGVLRAVAEEQHLDAALIDLNYTRDTTSGKEGLDLLDELKRADATLPIVVMTAWGSVETAVDAMRRGARDYLAKPWDNPRLLATVRTQVELGQALRARGRLEDENARLKRQQQPSLIAESRAMQPVLRILERVAESDANVLITGEHGTGKEVAARWLHAASKRADQPFVAINCGGVSEGVFESELFGHVRGAFTDARSDRLGSFEAADGGTLFLDEIGNMPMAQQARLLRVLQTGEFTPVGSSKLRRADVRVVSATNVDIGSEIAAGRFREDLLYRLNTVEVQLPPLRERREDVPRLALHVLARQAARYGKPVVEFAPDAMEALLNHGWPGNVRELEHVVERAVLLATGTRVELDDLALKPPSPSRTPQLEDMKLDEVERYLIAKALKRAGDNVSVAAAELGLSRSALYRRLAAYGIRGHE